LIPVRYAFQLSASDAFELHPDVRRFVWANTLRASDVNAYDSVEAKLATIAVNESAPELRRRKAFFALSQMVRDDHVCRRSFFAAGGATALLQLLHPNANPGLRVKAATLAADLFASPDPEQHAREGARFDEIHHKEARALKHAAMPHLIHMTTGGSADAREKAMHAVRAALDADAGDDEESAASTHRAAKGNEDTREYHATLARDAGSVAARLARETHRGGIHHVEL
jgi:hypothetical protein